MLNKILCVEDSRIMQNIYKRIFNEVDFSEEIIAVFNGREAIDYCNNLIKSEHSQADGYPDLIFLDLNMPVMGGWEFLDEFEKHFSDRFSKTKIVILTSSMDPQERTRAQKHPVVLDCLSKPLTFEMLDQLKPRLN